MPRRELACSTCNSAGAIIFSQIKYAILCTFSYWKARSSQRSQPTRFLKRIFVSVQGLVEPWAAYRVELWKGHCCPEFIHCKLYEYTSMRLEIYELTNWGTITDSSQELLHHALWTSVMFKKQVLWCHDNSAKVRAVPFPWPWINDPFEILQSHSSSMCSIDVSPALQNRWSCQTHKDPL